MNNEKPKKPEMIRTIDTEKILNLTLKICDWIRRNNQSEVLNLTFKVNGESLSLKDTLKYIDSNSEEMIELDFSYIKSIISSTSLGGLIKGALDARRDIKLNGMDSMEDHRGVFEDFAYTFGEGRSKILDPSYSQIMLSLIDFLTGVNYMLANGLDNIEDIPAFEEKIKVGQVERKFAVTFMNFDSDGSDERGIIDPMTLPKTLATLERDEIKPEVELMNDNCELDSNGEPIEEKGDRGVNMIIYYGLKEGRYCRPVAVVYPQDIKDSITGESYYNNFRIASKDKNMLKAIISILSLGHLIEFGQDQYMPIQED